MSLFVAYKLDLSKKTFLFLLFAVFLFSILFSPFFADAAGLVPCGGGEGEPSCGFCHLFQLAHNIVTFLLIPDNDLNNFAALVPILASILFALGGFFFLTAAGNPARLAQAQQIITATVVGLLIIYGSWLLVNLFLTSVGATIWGGVSEGWWKVSC
jgi:hypothetical protein